MEFDSLSKRVIGCAIEVHCELGPGLLVHNFNWNVGILEEWNGGLGMRDALSSSSIPTFQHPIIPCVTPSTEQPCAPSYSSW